MSGRRTTLAFVAMAMVAGCAKLPEYREDPLTTADIVLNIKCELRDAAWSDPRNAWVRNWNAGLNLSLIVDHSGGVDGDALWVFPFVGSSTFTFGLTGGVTGQGIRTERIDFKEGLIQLHADTKLQCEKEDPGRYARLGGRLDIGDLFARVGLMKSTANINPKQMDYNLDFIIRKTATAAPRFILVPTGKQQTFTGGLRLNGTRTDTHSLKISLVPPADRVEIACARDLIDGKCPTPVYIVPEPKEGLGPRSAPRRVSRPQGGGVSPLEADNLDRAQSRNLLQGIDDQLRRQGIGQ
jgi:hypothetical protein